MTWTNLTFSYGSTLTSAQMTQMFDNFAAMAAGNSGAPLVSALTPAYTSGVQTITSGGLLTLAHGLSNAPSHIRCNLYCSTGEGGWTAGDVIEAGSTMEYGGNNGIAVYADATNIYVRYGSATTVFLPPNKSTGASFSATNSYWRLIVEAWK